MTDRLADATRSLPPDPTAPFDPAATRSAEVSTSAAVIPPDLPPNYALIGELGRGAMGVVYQAQQVRLNREVALKLILSGRHASPQELARFLAEVQAAAAVDHPNVVRVYDSGEYAGTPYLAMELVSGGSLSEKLAGGPLPPCEAAELVAKVADGVQAAHAVGIVHRDLKPGNILLAVDGTPKVADFGLAKRPGVSDLTHTGAILGTPGYMAPEQARGHGKAVGPPADVYALGAVLFTCLAGRPPFVGADALEVVLKAAQDDPPSVRGLVKDTPRDLDTIVARCLRKDPAERYAKAGELADDLLRFLRGEPIRARRMGWVERAARGLRRWRLPVIFAVSVLLVGGGLAVAFLVLKGGWDNLFAPRNLTADVRRSPSADSISGDPRDIAERFLNDAQLNPTNPAALKWTSPGFQFTWTSGTGSGVRDRPYYKFTRPLFTETRTLDEQTVEYRGSVSVLKRVIARGGGTVELPSGGSADFILTVRANKTAGAWRVDSFEFTDRGCRAGPAELPVDVTEWTIRETLNYPPEAFERHTVKDFERMQGMQSWVFYHTGGPVKLFLTLEETGQQTIRPANLLASADRPYTSDEQEGRVCFQLFRNLAKEQGAFSLIESVSMRLNMNYGSSSSFPCLWYHWKGAEFREVVGSADLSDGKEHELLALAAVEVDPPKGEKPRKVVLRLLVKK